MYGLKTSRRAIRPAHVFQVMAAAMLAFLLGSCSRDVPLEPPVIHLGEDVCSHCSMIINEERFAAARVAAQGDAPAAAELFDDVSCLVARERATPGGTILARWVHAADGSGWIAANEAYFVTSPEIHSPMGGGALAAKSLQGAEAIRAQSPGNVLRFEELRAHLERGSRHGS